MQGLVKQCSIGVFLVQGVVIVRWMRWLLGLVVLLLAACAAASWWIGVQVEAQLRLAHAELSEQLGMPVELLDYRRGWFASTAESQVRLGQTRDAPVLHWQHRIAHGPLPYWRSFGLLATQSDLIVVPSATKMPASMPPEPVLLRVSSQLGLDRSARFVLFGQGGHFKDGHGGDWRLAPISGEFELGPAMRQVMLQLQWGGMAWNSAAGAQFSLGPVRADAQYQVPPGRKQLYDGQSTLHIDHIELRNVFPAEVPQQQQVPYALQLQALEWGARMNTEAEWGSVHTAMQAGAATLDGQVFGPVQATASLQAIHVPTLERVWPKLPAWLDAQLQPAPGASMGFAERQAVQNDIAAVFQQGLRVQLEHLSFYRQGGELVFEGALDAPTLTGMDLSFLPMSLASRINASVTAHMPEAVVIDRLGRQAAAALIAQDVLRPEGAQLSALVQYQRGVSTVNGVPIELARLKHWFE